MIGLDTNVLVRYIVRDDEAQTAAATRLVESRCTPEEPGIIDTTVLCELAWVLGRGYRYDRGTVANVIRQVLSVEELRVENAETAWHALRLFETGEADFADYLIGVANRRNNAFPTFTFDRKAAASELFELVP